jgi:hypothetical protein
VASDQEPFEQRFRESDPIIVEDSHTQDSRQIYLPACWHIRASSTSSSSLQIAYRRPPMRCTPRQSYIKESAGSMLELASPTRGSRWVIRSFQQPHLERFRTNFFGHRARVDALLFCWRWREEARYFDDPQYRRPLRSSLRGYRACYFICCPYISSTGRQGMRNTQVEVSLLRNENNKSARPLFIFIIVYHSPG